jgi:NAD(P)-dependent dehydrogenase (short-subunit alcohol dehydrogenase family)
MSEQRIAVVTGGTSGAGLSLVRGLTAQGHFVHFIGTRRERGAAIEMELNEGRTRCAFHPADLSSLRATAALAAQLEAALPQLDVLANVAGVMLSERRETAEGLELTMAVGHFSAFVLTHGLLPALGRAPHARVVNVAGVPRDVLRPSLDLDDLNHERHHKGVRVAIDAVHAKTVMAEVLAARLRGQQIDVNAFHPGWVRGGLGRDLPWHLKQVFKLIGPFMSDGSVSGMHATGAASIEGTTGQLFVKTQPRPLAFEAAYKDALWLRTVATVEGVLGNGWVANAA